MSIKLYFKDLFSREYYIFWLFLRATAFGVYYEENFGSESSDSVVQGKNISD